MTTEAAHRPLHPIWFPELGYVTLPVMALSGFAALIALSLLATDG
ncbi:hypothetical protein BH20ACT2_BH20ACT2_20390 [soil metagenome]